MTIKGNGIVKIVSMSTYLNGNIKKQHSMVSYNFIKGVIDEEEIFLLDFEPNLFSIGLISLLDQQRLNHISSLNMNQIR